MSDRLMSAEDLASVTGKKRFGKQVEWFRAQFGINVVCRGDGSAVMTWATFEALQARRAGLTGGRAYQSEDDGNVPEAARSAAQRYPSEPAEIGLNIRNAPRNIRKPLLDKALRAELLI